MGDPDPDGEDLTVGFGRFVSALILYIVYIYISLYICMYATIVDFRSLDPRMSNQKSQVKSGYIFLILLTYGVVFLPGYNSPRKAFSVK